MNNFINPAASIILSAFFVKSPSSSQSIETPNNQSALSALNEAFHNKSYVLLTAGFWSMLGKQDIEQQILYRKTPK